MNNTPIVPIVGGMGATMDDGVLNDPQPGADGPQAGIQVGVMGDKIGFQVVADGREPITLLFSVSEMIAMIAAQEQCIQHVREMQQQQWTQQLSALQAAYQQVGQPMPPAG